MPSETKQVEKDPLINGPLDAGGWFPSFLMFCVAAVGGALAFYQKAARGDSRPFNLTELIGELVTSGISGVLAYWVLQGFGVNPYLVAAGVGITGHMGSRAIFLTEKYIEAKAKKASE